MALVAHDPAHLELADVRRCRAFFDQYVDVLRDHRVINDDDCGTFKEIFPVFAPFYVAYDVDVTTTLAEISQRFGAPTPE